jgi:hypothetical protein
MRWSRDKIAPEDCGAATKDQMRADPVIGELYEMKRYISEMFFALTNAAWGPVIRISEFNICAVKVQKD